MSEDPWPPTSELENNTNRCRCPSWKLLICNLAGSMIHFILSRRPVSVTANSPLVRTRRPRHFVPPLGLIDLVCSKAPLLLSPSVGRQAERAASAPLVLSPSVGHHAERAASAPLVLSPSVGRHAERAASAPIVRSPSVDRFYRGWQFLVEVLAAYSDFPLRGTISIFDDYSSSYIYERRPDWTWNPDADFHSRKQDWLTTHADSRELFKNKLRLNGPGHPFSALCGFSFSASVLERNKYEYTTFYGSPCDFSSTSDEPKTITIPTHTGSLYVTYAVLSNAMRANLEVKVRFPWKTFSSEVHGHVTVYIGTFEIGTTIFSRDASEEEVVPFTDDERGIGTEICLPLDRSWVVVPLGSCLHIKGELAFSPWKPISIDHSITAERHFFETGWDEDEDLEIQTAVRLTLLDVWL